MQVVVNAAAAIGMSSVATALLTLAVLVWHHRERSRRVAQRWSRACRCQRVAREYDRVVGGV